MNPRLRRSLQLVIPVCFLTSTVASSYADTRLVPNQYPNIQAAIDASGNDDEVVVADGTYTGPGNREIDFSGKRITVRSENGPANCIIDCEDSGRGFYFHSGETRQTVLEGFTVQHGLTEIGGAVLCEASHPTIRNCIFRDNTADSSGGAIHCGSGSSPLISNCTIDANEAIWFGLPNGGGGITCTDGSNATITGCTITNNRAGHDGGGVRCFMSDALIENCTISDNVADGWGGGINIERSDTQVINCRFTGNHTVHEGGGIQIHTGPPGSGSASPLIANCLISGNSSMGHGGGISSWGDNASPTIVTCTISENSAGSYAGGLFCTGFTTVVTMDNCILWRNAAIVNGGRILQRLAGEECSAGTVVHRVMV